MSGLETAYRRDIEIRIADEELPPEGVAVIVDEFEHGGIVFDRDGVRVIAFEVDHGPAITPAYGYRIEYDGRVAVISGDTRYNENVIRFGTGVDLLVHEVAIAKPELMSEPFMQRIMAQARQRVDHSTICRRRCASSGHYKPLRACVHRTFVNPNSLHRRAKNSPRPSGAKSSHHLRPAPIRANTIPASIHSPSDNSW